jgi:hypothetical protein
MATEYCQLCRGFVNARRKIGVGTFILYLVTFGRWILMIPFYRKRCPICLADARTDEAATGALESRPNQQENVGWTGRVGCWKGRHAVWTVVLGSLFIGVPGNAFWQQQSDSNKPQATASTSAPKVQDANLPNIPPPKFRVFRFGTDVSTSYVVSVDTTDEQLRSLLWFFRQKVRTRAFKDIEITKPTTVQFGHFGYEWGRLVVYRNEKCADENYLSDGTLGSVGIAGPCGYGEHGDAIYLWGIEGDPAKDSGSIRAKNGDMVEVFSYKENWRPRTGALKDSTTR